MDKKIIFLWHDLRHVEKVGITNQTVMYNYELILSLYVNTLSSSAAFAFSMPIYKPQNVIVTRNMIQL